MAQFSWRGVRAQIAVVGTFSIVAGTVGVTVIGADLLGVAHRGFLVAQSGVERCFFPATWQKSDGSTFGGSLNCLKDKTDCREGAAEGSLASGVNITGEPSGCYFMGGGSTGETGGGYTRTGGGGTSRHKGENG